MRCVVNEDLTLAAIGFAVAVARFVCYRPASWSGRHRTLRAAERITRPFASEQALAPASPALGDKLERHRLAKIRARLGAPSPIHAAATALVREYRLCALEPH
jgi:hypothetical protein